MNANTPERALPHVKSSNCADLSTKMIPTHRWQQGRRALLLVESYVLYQDDPALVYYLQQAGLSNGRAAGGSIVQFFESVMSAINGKLANAIISE